MKLRIGKLDQRRAAQKRPGTIVYQSRFARRDRRKWVCGCLTAVLLLNLAAVLIWQATSLSLDSKADYVLGLHAVSWFPALLCLFASIIPQYTLRISRRGIAYACTQCGWLPKTASRWRVQWWEIDEISWGAGRCRLKSRSRTRLLHYAQFKKYEPRIPDALALHLTERFDLSKGTAEERFRRYWKHRSLWWKVLDKLLLLVIGLSYAVIPGLVGYACGRAVWPIVLAVLWMGAIVLVVYRERRFQGSFGILKPVLTAGHSVSGPAGEPGGSADGR